MIIIAKQLEKLKACQKQIDRFRELFGESVEVSEKLCLKHAEEFDWHWAAGNLLSAPARQEYERIEAPAQQKYELVKAQARQEYKRVEAQACQEYERIRTQALSSVYQTSWEYERVEAPAWQEYKRIRTQACQEYERVEAPAWREYKRAQAEVFGKIASRQSTKTPHSALIGV